jgi:hypothetical protein
LKKFIKTFAIFILWGLQTTNAQQIPKSCTGYKLNRSVSEYRELILWGKDPYIQNVLWPEYARIANIWLQTSAKPEVRAHVVTPDRAGMVWLFDHSVQKSWDAFDWRNLLDGYRQYNQLFLKDMRGTAGNWMALKYEDVLGPWSRSDCGNPTPPKEVPQLPTVTKHYIDSTIVRIHYVDSTVVTIKKVAKKKEVEEVEEIEEKEDKQVVYTEKKERAITRIFNFALGIWVTPSQGYNQTIPIAQSYWMPTSISADGRTMPISIGLNPNTSTSIGGDGRTMPGSIPR